MESWVQKLLDLGVIDEVEPGSWVTLSSHFYVPKKPGEDPRFIFNMKRLNLIIPLKKFKMASPKDLRKFIPKGAWASITDLESAYYSVPILRQFSKYT